MKKYRPKPYHFGFYRPLLVLPAILMSNGQIFYRKPFPRFTNTAGPRTQLLPPFFHLTYPHQ